MKFTVYIDESGDAGISRVRTEASPGSSPYFVIGAVVCQPTAEVHVKNAVADFRETIGKTKWKHATELDHAEKVLFARELGRLPVRYFAVVSNKATLAEYKDAINADPHKFYNKCVKYLLERVCTYLAPSLENCGDLRVILEKRNHDYGKMISYLNRVKANPIYAQSKSLSYLNPFAISTLEKGKTELLEVADFVAHAVFQTANKTPKNYGIPETRYFKEMESRFAGGTGNKILGMGVKCIHSLGDLQLDNDIEKIFLDAQSQPPSYTKR